VALHGWRVYCCTVRVAEQLQLVGLIGKALHAACVSLQQPTGGIVHSGMHPVAVSGIKACGRYCSANLILTCFCQGPFTTAGAAVAVSAAKFRSDRIKMILIVAIGVHG
jgi:hypothetical protein